MNSRYYWLLTIVVVMGIAVLLSFQLVGMEKRMRAHEQAMHAHEQAVSSELAEMKKRIVEYDKLVALKRGPAGPLGPKGERGPAGPQGTRGPAGVAGIKAYKKQLSRNLREAIVGTWVSKNQRGQTKYILTFTDTNHITAKMPYEMSDYNNAIYQVEGDTVLVIGKERSLPIFSLVGGKESSLVVYDRMYIEMPPDRDSIQVSYDGETIKMTRLKP